MFAQNEYIFSIWKHASSEMKKKKKKLIYSKNELCKVFLVSYDFLKIIFMQS